MVALVCVISLVVTSVIVFSAMRDNGPSRHHASAPLRGIQQSFVQYAQNNKGYYPGRDSLGNVTHASASDRIALLLAANLFTPEFAISNGDLDAVEADPPFVTGTDDERVSQVGPQNISYAMLDIRTPGGRLDEWKEDWSTEAVVLADRNVGSGPGDAARSVWSEHADKDHYTGTVVWNDNSTRTVNSPVIAETQYGDFAPNTNDDIFQSTLPHDALLVHD